MAFTVTGSTLAYNDLISAEDREFWQYLCKKDFRRLEKLLTQSMGEGHFVDDSGDDDSDDDENPATNNNKRLPGEGMKEQAVATMTPMTMKRAASIASWVSVTRVGLTEGAAMLEADLNEVLGCKIKMKMMILNMLMKIIGYR